MTPEQIAEIHLILENKCQELYGLIHKFRLGLERLTFGDALRSHNNIDEIMQFAGSWSDMPEEDFSNFCEEIKQRRVMDKTFR